VECWLQGIGTYTGGRLSQPFELASEKAILFNKSGILLFQIEILPIELNKGRR